MLEIVGHFAERRKPIAAVCHRVQILTAAGVIEGRGCTAYPPLRPEVSWAGGQWKELPLDQAYTDGSLVTAPAWLGHPASGGILELLSTRIEL